MGEVLRKSQDLIKTVNMLEAIYKKLRFLVSKKDEKGEASSGFIPPRVRGKALKLCEEKKGKLLDVGCGEGLFLAKVGEAASFTEVHGIDRSSEALKKSEKRTREKNINNILLREANAKEIPFVNNFFDVVVSLNFLYNVPSKEDASDIIREMARVSKCYGSVIFDFRNRLNPLISLAYKKARIYDPKCPWPLNAYSLQEIKDLSEIHGLKIKRIIPVVGIFGFLPLAYVIEAGKKHGS